jgi:cation transport regulator ChaB
MQSENDMPDEVKNQLEELKRIISENETQIINDLTRDMTPPPVPPKPFIQP